MKKSLTRIICFVIILSIVLLKVNYIFKFKYHDGIYHVTKLYELEDNTIDVLIIGSSHAYAHFNAAILWNEYGMAAYDLGGGSQPL